MAQRTPSERTIARVAARKAAIEQARTKHDKRKSRKTRWIITGALATIGVAAVVITSIANGTTPGSVTLPKGVSSATAPVTVGNPNAKTTLDLWEDFRCPACLNFEKVAGNQVLAAINAGTVKVNYHMVSFIGYDNRAATRRAANAGFAAYNQSPEAFLAFHKWAYANQPDETANDVLTTDQLVALSDKIGLKDPVAYRAAVSNMTYAGYVDKVNESMSANKIEATPTIFVNGTKFDFKPGSAPAFLALLQ